MPARAPLRRLVRYARGHRGRIVAATVYSALNKVFDLAPPVLIGMAVDVVTKGSGSFLASLGVEDLHGQLWVLGALTVIVWVLESVFQYAYDVTWRNLAQALQHELRIDAYAHVQRLEMGWFEDRSTGGLLAVLNDDVNQLERFLDVGANEIVQVVTTVAVIGGIFFALSPDLALLAMLPMPFVLWGTFAFQGRLAPRYADVRENAGRLSRQLANNVGGMATIKSFTNEEREIERIRDESEAYRTSNRRAIRLSAAFTPLIRMVILVGFMITLVYGGILALDGALAVGSYATLVFLIQRLLWPLTRLGTTFDLYQRAMASARRVLDLLDTPPAITGGDAALDESKRALEVRFEGVEFGYHGDLPVLHAIDLRLAAGRTTAIVGPTGSGKSTVVKLLLRFHDVDGGRVLVDGVDVRSLRLDSLRRAIGLVSQDVYLFDGTVRENVAYGRPDTDLDAIVEAARVAEAHEFIERLPHGYDTVIGERGQKLSGGQRQRLSIARAVLKDPPILVLDEATSSVDNETEAAIQRSLERIGRGRTVIVIAHRLSTVRNADAIHVLEEGRLVEQGRHEDLVRADGLYAALWSVQTGAASVRTQRART